MGGSLKEVRDRIKSVKSTQQITKAMKMVAAAKLRKAQQAITQMRPYADKLDSMLVNILSNLDGDVSTSYGVERPVNNALIIVMTSDRGLCGAFNSNVLKAAVKLVEGKYADAHKAGKLSMLFLGKKGQAYFKKNYNDIHFIEDYVHIFTKLNFNDASKVADRVMKDFDNGDFDSVTVAYAKFRNPAVQYFVGEQFLPVVDQDAKESNENSFNVDFIYEPNQKDLLEELVPSILRTTLFKYMLDTDASQHGARMTAMSAATDNAEELAKALKLSYNKARQEAITNEILEIVGGAAALDG
ncbi:MAG: ATP synthase F1 subunit gamma [Saprospiraceae bacterium]